MHKKWIHTSFLWAHFQSAKTYIHTLMRLVHNHRARNTEAVYQFRCNSMNLTSNRVGIKKTLHSKLGKSGFPQNQRRTTWYTKLINTSRWSHRSLNLTGSPAAVKMLTSPSTSAMSSGTTAVLAEEAMATRETPLGFPEKQAALLALVEIEQYLEGKNDFE